MDEPIRATRPEPPPHVSADVEVASTPIPKWAIGEFFTFQLVFFGCGSVCPAGNPARDLRPRLFSAISGWKTVPLTTNGFGWLTVYLVAPIVGGLLGGGIYRVLFNVGYRA